MFGWVDEFNSLFSYQCDYQDTTSLLNHLQTFLSSMQLRQQQQLPANEADFAAQLGIQYFEIQQHHRNAPPVVRYHRVPLEINRQYFPVQAIALRDSSDQLVFDIYCDQQEFRFLDWGKKLYPTVAKFITSRRDNEQNYPCYLTDLDLSAAFAASEPIQSVEYLRYKLALEQDISRALRPS